MDVMPLSWKADFLEDRDASSHRPTLSSRVGRETVNRPIRTEPSHRLARFMPPDVVTCGSVHAVCRSHMRVGERAAQRLWVKSASAHLPMKIS